VDGKDDREHGMIVEWTITTAGRLTMFDEFFYRRRKNKGLFIVMIALIVLGIGMFGMGFLYMFS
jgi:hypothetical protein